MDILGDSDEHVDLFWSLAGAGEGTHTASVSYILMPPTRYIVFVFNPNHFYCEYGNQASTLWVSFERFSADRFETNVS